MLRDFLDSTRRPLPDNWSAWLSLNQESDGTAIWLEQKFNVPDSGKWKNENVFHMPISKDHVELTHSYPGVVIFERTPLTGVTDILGRLGQILFLSARSDRRYLGNIAFWKIVLACVKLLRRFRWTDIMFRRCYASRGLSEIRIRPRTLMIWFVDQ